MARYIDADKMIDGYSTTFPYNLDYCDDGDLIEWLNAQPTADVVPKSEVDHWKEEANRYQTLWCKAYNDFEISEVVTQAKAEVAREIFEEIEKEIKGALKSNYKVLPQLEFSNELYNSVRGKIDALRGIEGFIAELKKKYTEEKI